MQVVRRRRVLTLFGVFFQLQDVFFFLTKPLRELYSRCFFALLISQEITHESVSLLAGSSTGCVFND